MKKLGFPGGCGIASAPSVFQKLWRRAFDVNQTQFGTSCEIRPETAEGREQTYRRVLEKAPQINGMLLPRSYHLNDTLLWKSIPSVLSGTTVTPVIIWGDSPGAQRWFRKPSIWLTCLCEFGTPSLLPTFSSDFRKQFYLYFNQHSLLNIKISLQRACWPIAHSDWCPHPDLNRDAITGNGF